jgi:hypothetical protein
MNARIYLAGLLALGSAVGIGCNHHHADESADRPQWDQGDNGTAKVVGTVDPPVVDNKAATPDKPVAPVADHVSTGGDLKKPDEPAVPDVPTPPKPQPAPVPDVPKPEAPPVPDPTVKPDAAKPDAPKPDAPAKSDAPAVPEPTVKPDAPAPDTSKPDAAKATDAAKAAIEKEVGTEDASKAKDAGK